MSYVIFKLQWRQMSVCSSFGLMLLGYSDALLLYRLVFRIKALQRTFITTNTALLSSVAGKDILKPKRAEL